MKLDKCYNFFFHPLTKEHSYPTKLLSVLTILALSILTGGLYAVAFGILFWRDRQIKIEPSDNPMTQIASSILSQSSPTAQMIPSASRRPDSPVKDVPSAPPQQQPPASIDPNIPKVELIKQEHKKQMEKFESWSSKGLWDQIRSNHYDWWMFPVDRGSIQYGEAFQVGTEEVEALKEDPDFMQAYRRGVQLTIQSWGWDLEQDQPLQADPKNPHDPKWVLHDVRLGKISNSLLLFGETELHKKLKKFFNEYCLQRSELTQYEKWVGISLLGKESYHKEIAALSLKAKKRS